MTDSEPRSACDRFEGVFILASVPEKQSVFSNSMIEISHFIYGMIFDLLERLIT